MPSIVGTWKLVRATARDAAGAARPAGVSREYNSYCGNYTYDGEKLVTRVDAASDPSRIGGDQVRGVRFEGARMVLIPPPRRIGEGEEHREITWERIAAE
jgi:hypothetical protein